MATDWQTLWHDLASRDVMSSPEGEAQLIERWRHVARQLDSDGAEPDALLQYVQDQLQAHMSVLDIGAGVGRWTIPLAERVRSITAVEPLAGMRKVLLERIAAHRLANVTVLDTAWLATDIAPHDVCIAVHSTYTTTDLLGFVAKMESSARKCYLVLRVPARDGLVGVLAERIHGCWHD